jgi:hypothetical protein
MKQLAVDVIELDLHCQSPINLIQQNFYSLFIFSWNIEHGKPQLPHKSTFARRQVP